MSISDLFKKKELPAFEVPGHMQKQPLEPPKPDVLAQKYMENTQPKVTNEDLMTGIKAILNNQKLIYDAVKKEPEPVVLDENELKYISEEDKDAYLELKANNPKLAANVLKGYMAQEKKKA